MDGFLAPYRVLDLTNERGLLCGEILGDLGADVIAVEPPGGSSARRIGPFVDDRSDPEGSLFWWAHSRNKRSVVVDLHAAEGVALLRRLVERADVLVESEMPGTLGRLGLGYDELSRLNPRLVYVSITAFGQSGPKAEYADSDLVVLAAGGPLILAGDEDRPPIRVSVPQAYAHAGAEAAGAALIALHEAMRSGRGQHVDVSAQQAVAQATQSNILAEAIGHFPFRRFAGGVRTGRLVVRFLYPAKDGFVSITHLFGSSAGPFTRRLMEWVFECGFCDAAMRDKDWIGYTELLLDGREPVEEFERVKQALARFTASKTKAELLRGALERGVLVAPVAQIDEVIESEQSKARNYWVEVNHPELGRSLRYPGAFVRCATRPITVRRRPPRIGEHGDEIKALAAVEIMHRTEERPTRTADEAPLSDVKVLDFTWAMAGPAATRTLADYGATVVRVESRRRVDAVRTVQPFHDGKPGAENAAVFKNLNAGKLMITLDLETEPAREVARDLVRWADVVVESFTAGTMRGWKLDYGELRMVKPDLIMLSTCLMGQTGPLSAFAGFGNLAAAISGFFNVTGWPDRPPAGPFGAYTDYVSPRFTVAAILAALDHRRRTGEGSYLDQSQAEASLHFLGPAILDYTVNGRVVGRIGNRDTAAVPHGVYPANGDDRWVALAVATEEHWQSFCLAIGRTDLAADVRFRRPSARRQNEDELDSIIASWTRQREAGEIEALLQRRGVAAHAVQSSADLLRDPQLLYRGHFVTIEDAEHGETTVESSRFRLSRTPAAVRGPAPTLGRDNQYVLEKILGYDEKRLSDLVVAGALE